MNIVNITPFYPPHLGGMEKVAEGMGIALAKQGQIVIALTTDLGYDKNYHDPIRKGYSVTRMKGSLIGNLPIMWNLVPHLIKIKRHNTIFHVHVAQAFIPEIVLIIAKLKRCPFVAHFHLDVAPSGKFRMVFIAYKKWIFPSMLRSADRVIVFSEEQATELSKSYGVKVHKIAIIPNSVDDAFFYNKLRAFHTKPRLLFVGRLSPQKNIDQLFHALDGVSEQFETSIVGDGELKPQLEKLCNDLKLKNVHFDGALRGKKLVDAYRKSDVLILTSTHEGMPLVILEAMATGAPAVTTDVPGNRDIVEDDKNGLLVPLNDLEALRKALMKIRTMPKLYARLSKKARETANEHSWDKSVVRLNDMYRQIRRD